MKKESAAGSTEERVAWLAEENSRLREQNEAIVEARVALSRDVARLTSLLERSVHVEKVEFEDGEKGCRFIIGENHVVAEWRGDGVATDTVFVEGTALEYGITTTPYIRCMRMVLEMAHWEVLCAIVAGPGDGKLKEADSLDFERQSVVDHLRYHARCKECGASLEGTARVIERGDHI